MGKADSLLYGGYSTIETYIYIRGLARVDLDVVVEHLKTNNISIDYTEEDSIQLAALLKDLLICRVEEEDIKNPVLAELLRESINNIDFNEVAEHYISEVVEAVEED